MATGTGLGSYFQQPRLSARQRRQLNRIRRTQGQEAGAAWRQQKLQDKRGGPAGSGLGNVFRGQGYDKLDKTLLQGGDAQWRSNVISNDINAVYNRPNINSAYGNVNVTQDPETGQWTVNQSVNPEQQAILSGAWGGTSNLMQQAANQGAFNPETEANRARVEQNVMDRFNRLNDSQFKAQEASFRQRMADQGIQEGGADWNTRYQQEVVQPQTLARQEALSGAVNQGLGEQQQSFNQALVGRQLPFQQMQQLMALTGQIQQPQAIWGNTNINPVDMMGPQSTLQLGRETMKNQQDLAHIQGGYQLGAAQITAGAGEGADMPAPPPIDPNAQAKMAWGVYPQQNQGWMQQQGGQQPWMQGPPGWRWNGQQWMQG